MPVPECENEINPQHHMFTRSNRQNGQLVTTSTVPGVFRATRRTIFIIHGYMNNKDTAWLHNIKNRMLDRGDYNVVITGWGGGSSNIFYPQSASNTRVVGALTALVAQALQSRGLSRANTWCTGHSLGAHTCGFAGKRNRWGKLTGMDPAGPLFESYSNQARMYRTDGNFVDVLHTMGKGGIGMDFGTMVPLGHADFYPNGGGIQPGCANKQDLSAEARLACSHGRAHAYYLESINSNCFNVRQRCTNENNIPGSCSPCGGVCTTMGFHSNSARHGKFNLDTNGNSPYCRA